MTFRTLILASLRFHWRTHLGVLLGAILGSAVLIGALVVGDSVRGSLQDLGLQRLPGTHLALSTGDRFYRSELFNSLEPHHTLAGHLQSQGPIDPARLELTAYPVSLLQLPGTASRQDRTARANRIQVYGLPTGSVFRRPESSIPTKPGFENAIAEMEWEHRINQSVGTVILNEALAIQLKARPGDEIVLRLHKPSALSRDAVITPRDDQSIALRLTVHSIITGEEGGNLSLASSQVAPLNAFVRIEELDQAVGLSGRANLTLMPPFVLREDWKGPSRWMRWFSVNWRRFFRMPPPPDTEDRPLAPDADQLAMLNGALGHLWELPDAELELRNAPGGPSQLELISRRIFLEDAVVAAARGVMRTNRWRPDLASLPSDRATHSSGILTYLVNEIRFGDRATPYSMVTAAEAPWVPTNLHDDEILLNEWLAEDLQCKVGDEINLSYYLLDTGAQLVERTNRFRVRAVVPMEGIHADRTLMPEFPGLTKAESTRDWDAGFKLVNPIRDKDESYWKKYRGTPKAFVTLAAGQRMWANRFGRLTSIRYSLPAGVEVTTGREAIEATVLSNLDPARVGLAFQPVREQALHAAGDGQDFGGLFIGFSFFLILAALILMAMLFGFGVEQRQIEIGTLLAFGFSPTRIRRLFWTEGLLLASLGAVIGVAGGIYYAKAMLWALGTLWRDAVGTSALRFHLTPPTLMIAVFSAVMVSSLTIWLVIRKQGRRPARELLAGQGENFSSMSVRSQGRVTGWITWIGLIGAVGMIGTAIVRHETANAETFFGAGALAMIGGLAAASSWLGRLARSESGGGLSRWALAVRGLGRRRTRSLATAALLACGSFLVVSIGTNRLDATRDAHRRDAGTGGFSLLAQSSLPVVQDLNTRSGREALGLNESGLTNMSLVPFRVRPGDDASCLNLNRAQNPQLLGVNPARLAERGAFSLAGVSSGLDASAGWRLLQRANETDPIPAIGDAASIQWALGRKLGDILSFTDERGEEFKVKLVASLVNSVLQGNLILDESAFARHFPSLAGYQFFLIDVPDAARDEVSSELARGLQNYGLEAIPTVTRLAQFNSVQNTYLNTFQVLGGLGLLLGSAGLGVVLLRNALERRSELALLRAVGFRAHALRLTVLGEHVLLLTLGLGVGVGSALLAVLPIWFSPNKDFPVQMLTILLSGVFLLGLLSAWAATRFALRGGLIDNLRAE